MTIDLSIASLDVADGLLADPQRQLLIPVDGWASRFETDLLAAAQLIAPTKVPAEVATFQLEQSLPLDDEVELESRQDSSAIEQLMWLGVAFPPPIEPVPVQSEAVTEDHAVPLVPSDLLAQPQPSFPHPREEEQTLITDSVAKLAVVPGPESTVPEPVEVPKLDTGVQLKPGTQSSAIGSPPATTDVRLFLDMSQSEVRPTVGDPEPTPMAVTIVPELEDAPQGEFENAAPVDQPAGYASVPPTGLRSNSPTAATEAAHSPRRILNEPRPELSEVVRQVRTMVTEHETRSTIQLEPAELGRMTVELVDAPDGLRAYVSAEDPTVLRFLERNVQLLESEARLQGVGNMSISVGADVSGGLGRGDQRQSETEAFYRRGSEWNAAPPAKPRSRRELDTNA